MYLGEIDEIYFVSDVIGRGLIALNRIQFDTPDFNFHESSPKKEGRKMTIKNSLKLTLCAGAALLMAACATNTAPSAEKVAEAETMKATADELSQTNTTTKSADGSVICKRQTVVGSNFKRKVCATAEQWEAMEADSRRSTGDLQRRGAGPGTGN